MDVAGGEEVLANLVRNDTVAGFLRGQRGQGLGFRRRGAGRGVHDRVYLVLGQLGQPGLRRLRLPRKPACLTNGLQIAVGGGTHGSVARGWQEGSVNGR